MTDLKDELSNLTFEGPSQSFEKAIKKDKELAAIGVAVLVGFLVSPSVLRFHDRAIKGLFIVAFLFDLVGTVLLLWHYFRSPKRMELLERLTKDTAGHVGDITSKITKAYVVPAERGRIHELLSKTKSVTEAIKTIDAEEQASDAEKQKEADDLLSSLITLLLMVATKKDYDDAFSKPLDESHAKIKHSIDKLSVRLRIPIFNFGITITAMAILFDLISK